MSAPPACAMLYQEALTPTGMRMGLAGRPCAKSKSYTGGPLNGVSQKPGTPVLEIRAQRRIKVIALQEQEDALNKHIGLLELLIDNAADYVAGQVPALEALRCDTSAKRDLIIAKIEALL